MNLILGLHVFYQHGRFPGSDKFTNVPHVDMPIFLKTEMSLSPPDLYKKFAGTDAKGLGSLHALAALNIYFGGIRIASQTAFSELLKNLTYQALSQENDDIFSSFEEGINLVHSIVNAFAEMETREFEIASQVTEQINDKLDMRFDVIEPPAMRIQLGQEKNKLEHEPKPIEFSTPLKIEKIDKIHDREKSNFLKIAMKLSPIDLESASQVADSENEALIEEIINPMPGLVVDEDISVDTQFSFKNSDLDTSFTLSDTHKTRLNDIIKDARKKN